MHVAIEGNISAGKTCLTQALSQLLESNKVAHQILPEPVKTWQNFGPESVNLLDKMYNNDLGASFNFQLCALITKCEQLQNCKSEAVSIVERSLLAQIEVFLPLLLQENKIDKTQFELCDRIMKYCLGIKNNCPNLILYLRTNPTVLLNRIAVRGRPEEGHISLPYLQKVHANYEKWLCSEYNTIPVITLEADFFENLEVTKVYSLLRKAIKF